MIFVGTLVGCNKAETANSDTQQSFVVDYTLWGKVLRNHVNDQGRVDYSGLKANMGGLNQFIQQVENADITSLSAVEQKTFWINAYNALTLKVVADNYPVKSIRGINLGLVWKMGRKVAGGKKSLGDIEHKILRPLGDPRIHFAINCASIGCPKLPNKPFYVETLNEQLDYETRRFVNDSEKISLDKTQNILHHSAILEWFEEDFLVVAPNILGYIAKYINEEDRMYLESNEVTVQAMKYDWGINKQ